MSALEIGLTLYSLTMSLIAARFWHLWRIWDRRLTAYMNADYFQGLKP